MNPAARSEFLGTQTFRSIYKFFLQGPQSGDTRIATIDKGRN